MGIGQSLGVGRNNLINCWVVPSDCLVYDPGAVETLPLASYYRKSKYATARSDKLKRNMNHKVNKVNEPP